MTCLTGEEFLVLTCPELYLCPECELVGHSASGQSACQPFVICVALLAGYTDTPGTKIHRPGPTVLPWG